MKHGDTPPLTVDLWTARIPHLARFAEHHWLNIQRPDRTDRWEVWQSKNAGGEKSWGHLYLNLLEPTAGVGNGPGWMLMRWTGSDAEALAERLENAPETYPWARTYLVVPGPNSNTFIQWVLRDRYRLGWRGIGRGFVRLLGRAW